MASVPNFHNREFHFEKVPTDETTWPNPWPADCAIVIKRKNLVSRRGTHFRICSCVHRHVSHAVVHMSQHKSSTVHQDEF